MGLQQFHTYDVQGCVNACLERPISSGGSCKYVNIWRAKSHRTGKIGMTTCSFVRASGLYYTVTELTPLWLVWQYSETAHSRMATNTGQGDIEVTFSRGYELK